MPSLPLFLFLAMTSIKTSSAGLPNRGTQAVLESPALTISFLS